MSGSRWTARLAAALSVVSLVTAGLVAAGAPAAARAPEAPKGGTFSSIIDPVTGQEIVAGVDLQAGAVTSGVTRNLAGLYCRSATYLYLIYFRIPYRELLRWQFRFTWCWQNKSEAFGTAASTLVVQATSSERMILKDPVIVIEGSWAKRIGRIPASVVQVRWDGARFRYCPPTPLGCFGQFVPIVDLYLLAGGGISDHSVY